MARTCRISAVSLPTLPDLGGLLKARELRMRGGPNAFAMASFRLLPSTHRRMKNGFRPVIDNPVRMGFAPGWSWGADLTERLTDLEHAVGKVSVVRARREPCLAESPSFRWAGAFVKASVSNCPTPHLCTENRGENHRDTTNTERRSRNQRRAAVPAAAATPEPGC